MNNPLVSAALYPYQKFMFYVLLHFFILFWHIYNLKALAKRKEMLLIVSCLAAHAGIYAEAGGCPGQKAQDILEV